MDCYETYYNRVNTTGANYAFHKVLGKRKREPKGAEPDEVVKKQRISNCPVAHSEVSLWKENDRRKLIGEPISYFIYAGKDDLLHSYLSSQQRQEEEIPLCIKRNVSNICPLLRDIQEKFPNITKLSFECPLPTQKINQILTSCPQLVALEFDGYERVVETFADAILPARLQEVSLNRVVLSDAALKELALLPDLSRLYFNDCRFECSNTLLFNEKRSIKMARFSKCTMNDAVFAKLMMAYSELKYLEVDRCSSISPEVFADVIYSPEMTWKI